MDAWIPEDSFIYRCHCGENVDVSIRARIKDRDDWTLYISDHYWVVEIDGCFEFYYNPKHFMGKIDGASMPDIALRCLRRECAIFTPEDRRKFDHMSNRELEDWIEETLRPSSVDIDRMSFSVGNWFNGPGRDYVTVNGRFIQRFFSNQPGGLVRECSLSEINWFFVQEMLESYPVTTTFRSVRGVFDLRIFSGVDVSGIIIRPLHDESWDAAAWAKRFQEISQEIQNARPGEHSHESNMTIMRAMRVDVFRHTVFTVRQGSYVSPGGQVVELPDPTEMVRGSVLYSAPIRLPAAERSFETQVRVENVDCLVAACALREEGCNPAVLNMASRQNPGGGVAGGAGAQEENLFRRSNLFQSMYRYVDYAPQYGFAAAPERYPLDRNYGGVYTPNAAIFRGTEQEGYPLLDAWVPISVISVAGINRPDLDENGQIAHWLIEPVKNKIRTIFRIGALHGHDALVLGALGCGAFRNPPDHVARLFHEVMEEAEFKGRFRCILFAILEDHNSRLSHNQEGNFLPFLQEFAPDKADAE